MTHDIRAKLHRQRYVVVVVYDYYLFASAHELYSQKLNVYIKHTEREKYLHIFLYDSLTKVIKWHINRRNNNKKKRIEEGMKCKE